MKMVSKDYVWYGTLELRMKTKFIVLHHANAKVCSAEDIDRWHKENGWAGIG